MLDAELLQQASPLGQKQGSWSTSSNTLDVLYISQQRGLSAGHAKERAVVTCDITLLPPRLCVSSFRTCQVHSKAPHLVGQQPHAEDGAIDHGDALLLQVRQQVPQRLVVQRVVAVRQDRLHAACRGPAAVRSGHQTWIEHRLRNTATAHSVCGSEMIQHGSHAACVGWQRWKPMRSTNSNKATAPTHISIRGAFAETEDRLEGHPTSRSTVATQKEPTCKGRLWRLAPSARCNESRHNKCNMHL